MGGELGTCTVLASARDPVLGEALSTRTPLAQLGFCHMASRLPCSASQSATPPAAHAVMMTCTARRACSHSVCPYQGRQGQLPGLSTMHHKVLQHAELARLRARGLPAQCSLVIYMKSFLHVGPT